MSFLYPEGVTNYPNGISTDSGLFIPGVIKTNNVQMGTLSAAQILALTVDRVEAIPAQGENTVIIPKFLIMKLDFNTTKYAFDNSTYKFLNLLLLNGDGGVVLYNLAGEALNNFMTASASILTFAALSSFKPTIDVKQTTIAAPISNTLFNIPIDANNVNVPVNFFMENVAVTGGDSPIDFKIVYDVWSV